MRELSPCPCKRWPRQWGHVFLIGEAAGLISASSFEGISSAFLSGKYLADAFASEKDPDKVLKYYKRKTSKLRLKLFFKIPKMKILCSPLLRKMIMKSGICSIEKYWKRAESLRHILSFLIGRVRKLHCAGSFHHFRGPKLRNAGSPSPEGGWLASANSFGYSANIILA